jgi:hypothetical protein
MTMFRSAALVLSALAILMSANAVAQADDAAATHYSGALADGASWIADVPATWNGTVILYSHGYGPLVAQDAPGAEVQQDLLDLGYALVGSSYSGPSWWALAPAVDDQFGALAALERQIDRPRRVIAWGTSMGGLISALEAERGAGRIDGALTTCGLVAGALNLNNYQLDGEWALSHLIAPEQVIPLVDYASPQQAAGAASALTGVVASAQSTPQGRARTALGAALMNEPTWAPGDAQPAAADYAGQESQQAQELSWVLGFVMSGRYQIELAAGGNSSGNAGVDYAALLRHSPERKEVQALYAAAGLDLDADLTTLTKDADIHGDPGAATTLGRTSMVIGRLAVPELDIHTVADHLIPVAHENWYADQVREAGRAGLFRQAYVDATGHCNFQPAGLIAALHAVEHRIDTGSWDDVADPQRLNAAATASGLGPFQPYLRFEPPPLTGERR